MAVAHARFSPGDVLRGKYRIKRVLGEGGMGLVVRATHLRLDQDVAIKVLREAGATRPNVVARFAREARAAARLKGDHAVRILDVDDEGDEPFLVMEYLEGSDLDRLVRKEGPLDPGRAVDYALQICEGLAEAHALGIVHRDIKPANMFLAKTPRGGEIVKILDFGISKAPEGKDPTITEGERVLGSPAFMSPEQLKSARDVDARTDIWSLGVLLYFLVSGKLPFDGEDATAVAARIASEDPKPLAGTPPELADVVMRCLAKDRETRFASVADVARALAPLTLAGEVAAKRVSSQLRMPVAQRPSGRSSTSGPAALAGPLTASLEAVAEGPADKLTASLDAPGPVSLGVITNAGTPTQTRDSVTPPRSRRNRMLLGAAAASVAAIFVWTMRKEDPPIDPARPQEARSAALRPEHVAEIGTQPVSSMLAPISPDAGNVIAPSSTTASPAMSRPAASASPANAETSTRSSARDAGTPQPSRSAQVDDPLKLDIK